MPSAGSSLQEIRRIDRSAFNMSEGLRAGAFVSAPLLLGIATGQMEFVYTALGALFLTNSQGPRTGPTPVRLLFVACFIEALAFGIGTLAGTTGWLAIPLTGIGVFLGLMLGIYRGWGSVAMLTAINFAVGVGLLGGSVTAAGDRLVFSLLGGLWAFAGIELRQFFVSRRVTPRSVVDAPLGSPTGSGSIEFQPRKSWMQSDAFKHAAIVGAAAMIGHSVGLVLGLPRDFWIVVTIIIALRPTIGETFTSTSLIVLGTAIGAIIAASVTLTITNDYLLWTLLLAFSIGLFATRNMNVGLTQVFLTPLIIILLNILYPGQWQLAEARILDVAIGGAISLLTVYLLWVRRAAQRALSPTHGVPPSAGGISPSSQQEAADFVSRTARNTYCECSGTTVR